ncbi:MAG: tyrosine-type recombinase/integrase [Treponema sp.]|jgi:integrase/recombinase XerC|nr:tyrosine-type recombinase/integrase [Treponema sp.]
MNSEKPRLTGPGGRAFSEIPAGAIGEYLRYLRAVRGVSERTLAAYGTDLSRFAAYCGNRESAPETADSYGVEHFIADLSAEGMSSVSVNRALSSLRGFYRWLVRTGKRSDDPALGLRNRKTPKVLPAFLWEGEMAAFAGLPEKEGILWPPRDKALILSMYSAGLRISELASLDEDALDENRLSARVLGKGGRERIVFFSGEAARALEEYLPARLAAIRREKPTGRLFVNRRGGPLSVPGIRWIIGRYGDRSGLGKHVHPHALRHSFATHLVNSGCDVRLVQELLGHASISTTQRYTHLDMEHLREAYMRAHPHAYAASSGKVQPHSSRPRPEGTHAYALLAARRDGGAYERNSL